MPDRVTTQPEIAPDRVERAAKAMHERENVEIVHLSTWPGPESWEEADQEWWTFMAQAALVAAGVPELERLHRITVGLAGSGKLDCLTFDPATDDDACGDCWTCQLWDALAALEPPHAEPEGEK